MAYNYEKLKAKAAAKLFHFGISGVLKKRTEIPKDETQPWEGNESAIIEIPVKVVMVAFRTKDTFKTELSEVEGRHKKAIFSLKDLTTEQLPSIDDRLVVAGETWTIVSMNTVSPGGVPLVCISKVVI